MMGIEKESIIYRSVKGIEEGQSESKIIKVDARSNTASAEE